MKKSEKEEFVAWLKGELENAPAIVLADYRGLTVEQMTALRSKCREAGVSLRVAKNTLTKIAIEGTPFEPVKELLTGPVALAWHGEDPGASARVLVEFAKIKTNQDLEIRGGAISGRVLTADQVKNVLATMPSREELLAQMAGLLYAGPQKLHAVLSAGPNKLGRVIAALKEKKEAA